MSNRYTRRWFVTPLALLFSVGITGASISPSELAALVHRLQNHYQATASFTAKFTETLTSPGAPPRIRTGKVAYHKAGLIHWEFDAPQPETIVGDGATLYDYDPALNQVIEMPLKYAFKSRSALAFILGAGNLERDFVARPGPETSDDLVHLSLTPKDSGDKIELAVDSKTLNIMDLRVRDALGNITTLQFSDLERNVALDLRQFKFTPPAGADIVNTVTVR
jgi:outer membrane lipoprotein carrier protein